MATIIEGALWTVTEEIAEHMVQTGLLVKCSNEHINMLNIDKPIYHIGPNAPEWFGFATIMGAIMSAEKAVAEAKEKIILKDFTEGIFPHECEAVGCSRIIQFDDEPYCFTHSPDEGSSVRGYSARRVQAGRVN